MNTESEVGEDTLRDFEVPHIPHDSIAAFALLRHVAGRAAQMAWPNPWESGPMFGCDQAASFDRVSQTFDGETMARASVFAFTPLSSTSHPTPLHSSFCRRPWLHSGSSSLDPT